MESEMNQRTLSPFETLPQELLSSIIEDLRPHDLTSFLRVCKRFYHAGRPRLWHTLRSPDLPRSFRFAATTPGLCNLAAISDDIGVDAMGFAYVKKLVFKVGEMACTQGGPDRGLDRLSNILCDQLVAGKMELQHVELCWGDFSYASEGAIRLLNTLKEYQKLNLPRKPSIMTKMGHAYKRGTPSFPINHFALECITNLEIGFYMDDTLLMIEQAVHDIELLTNTLKGARFLQRLVIVGEGYAGGTECPISGLPQLEKLQDAVTDLKHLVELRISGYLFHPSFFLAPPENTKKVTIKQEISIAWWRKFAQCPFTGLEDLSIDTSHVGIESVALWASGDDEEITEVGNEDFQFLLGNLEIRGLKKFSTCADWYYRPDDFADLLRRKNPGLKEFTRVDGVYI
ncbi:hypothetical protein TWF281_002181 [Arthrobotrys megalospora]